ncbi:sensor histidine kinase [Mesobacterium pallidum]|uniref:sensor histidine kinase n=1 Tax=Mesobacterium pallidum TaxID=2872037 RepID=UPI001EE2CAE9|nr:sensor histidine kinase [Mesobacterium pallidum]
MRPLLILIALVLQSLALSAQPDNRLSLGAERLDWPEVRAFVGTYEDVTRDADLGDAIGAEYRPVDGETVDFGYTKSVIWLRLRIENAQRRDTWRLSVRENFFQIYEVYRVDPDGTVTVLDNQGPLTPFAGRSVAYPELTTEFELPQGAATDLYIRFWSGGSSELSFSLMTVQAFNDWSAGKTARNFVYYGIGLFLVAAAVVCYLVTWRGVFLAYSIYALFGTLFVMHGDGNTFKYLWPERPLLNDNASAFIGAGLVVFGANFARVFLQTRQRHPVMDKVLIAVMAMTLAILASGLFVDMQIVKRLLILASLIGIITFVVSGLVAARTRFREVRFYVLAWAGAVVSSGIMNLRHWLGIEIPEEVQFNSMRIVLIMDAVLMGLAILDRFNQLRAARQEALELSLSEAQRNVALSARMAELETDFELLQDLTRTREQSLADTAHDLRQPLHALRLNVRRMMNREGRGAVDATEVEETFAYLEGLVATGLETVERADASGASRPAEDAPTDVGEVLGSVAEMFAPDAEAKGLTLRHVATGATTRVPPLAMMRMVTNLVSNAVKYTETGGVLLGVRRHGGTTRIEVHDTGPGLGAGGLAAALPRHARHSDIEGSGLGLDIVRQLAEAHGCGFGYRARPYGCVFYIDLP